MNETPDTHEQTPPRPRPLPIAIGLVLLAVATWFIFSSRTDPAVRECTALYGEARTAADTAEVDFTVPEAAAGHAQARNCGSYRTSGWSQ